MLSQHVMESTISPSSPVSFQWRVAFRSEIWVLAVLIVTAITSLSPFSEKDKEYIYAYICICMSMHMCVHICMHTYLNPYLFIYLFILKTMSLYHTSIPIQNNRVCFHLSIFATPFFKSEKSCSYFP